MFMTSVHLPYTIYVLFVFVTRIMYSNAACPCDQPDSDFATDVNFVYYKCNNETPATIAYPITAPQDLLKVLEDKRTIFYVFGYLEVPEDPNVQYILEALCYGRTDNIVLFDWSKYSTGSYKIVSENVQKVGSLFAQGIRLLVEDGLNASRIYIVGHSLGAHIAGFAGQCNKFVIFRITGLDPANPVFYPAECYLTAKDAEWVDIIHTDQGTYNTMGTADYYVNSSILPQPGCKLNPLMVEDLCSHQGSDSLYADSKMHPTKYIAVQCPTYLLCGTNFCKNNLHTNVGYFALNVNGLFCVYKIKE